MQKISEAMKLKPSFKSPLALRTRNYSDPNNDNLSQYSPNSTETTKSNSSQICKRQGDVYVKTKKKNGDMFMQKQKKRMEISIVQDLYKIKE